jgi:hypothetical protein
MLAQMFRIITRPLIGPILGAAAGALYAGLVTTVHVAVYGRWDEIPIFGAGCVLVGALFGLILYAFLSDS